ncbi:SpaA isopeptide-forming pilin-related protein [Brevibacterium casei]|uniref:SpaA isopeptide-forming pilin-related protein n=1 Tax=Brevibacterium casei TaxID=33889 RepID=UPI00223B1DA8|nr:SpaA isopeptide-forming pilin-related protein [Brevibacterium casei]MCT1550241.1 SpaA isopeptide-forming pilin-related protein [Brevibacterium casei]MCT1562087.1 SpaA isopeptide-forming pilin-related protein [Brevibacterium casei]MCT2208344.1 SpaA isopeptide-forming pilin-related protein [Brevibacterium casei]
MVLSAFVVLVLLFGLSGVLMAPAPAAASGSGLGEAPSSPSESSTPSESASPSPSEGSSGSGLQDSGGASQSEPAPSGSSSPSPSPSQSEPAPMPTRVEPQATMYCTPGNVYSITNTKPSAQMQRISATGVVTPVGAPATIATQFNGLGIGSGGDPIYAYDRYDANATGKLRMYIFNHATDTWTNTNRTYDTTLTANGAFNGSLVAGGVDLSTDRYYFGGFVSGGQTFKLWTYNHTTGVFAYKGSVATPGSGVNANGDLAFDSKGNLFILRNSGTESKIFSVTNEQVAAANGGTMTATSTQPKPTASSVNGFAIDSDGRAYLGAGSSVYSYSMPGFGDEQLVTNQLGSTTDLAACGSAPTVTLEKDVQNRASASDQFNLTLAQGSNLMGTTTTSGTTNGVQAQQVGPMVVGRGAQITFSETGASGTDMSKYSSTYSCTIDGQPLTGSSGTGTSKTITVPGAGTEIVCRFVNSALTADVTINKKTQDQNGGNQQNASGWTVGSRATAATGTVTQSPTAATQQTGTDGNAKWTINFGSTSARANLAVLEQQQSGYEFVSGSCVITRAGSSPITVTLNSASEQTLSQQIQPGDKVECGYVNKKSSADVTVNKNWVIDGKTVANGSQPAGMSAKLLLDPAGQPAGDPAFGQKRTGFAVGDTVKIGETATIDSQKFPGCSVKTKTISGPGITGTVALTDTFSTKLPGASNTYTVTNTVECQTLTITKDVENDNGGELTAADWNQRLFSTRDGGSAVPFDSGEKKYVTSGTYLISENSLPGYEQVSIRCTGATYDEKTKKVSIAAGQNAECIVANADSAGTVSWEKTSESGDLLDGSEWTIRDADGNEIDLDDCVAASAEGCSGRDRNPKAGQFRVEDLKWGDYTLVETKAPAGYELDETERPFTISRDRLDFAFEEPIVNKQAESPQLPFTGGIGTTGYIIGGAALLLAGAAAAAWQHRRRVQGRS